MAELEPPPFVINDFQGWKNWFKNLYEYITDMSSKDPHYVLAVNDILVNYGDKVSIEAKAKPLIKFGRVALNNNTTYKTVEAQPIITQYDETFTTTNSINRIVSSSALDAAANNSSDGWLEGHTVSGGVFTFVRQQVILTGQTAVTLATPLARVTRWYNDDSAVTVGKISIYESAVTTIVAGSPSAGYTGVHLTIRAGKQNSEKCSTTISNTDYWIVSGIYADILSKANEDVVLDFEVREAGKVFREYFKFSASDTAGAFRSSHPYIIIPKNADVRIRASGDGTAGIIVSAGMFGRLAKIV